MPVRSRLMAPMLLAAAVLLAPAADASAEAYHIRGARVVPVAGPPLEQGDILIRNGRIVAVAPRLDPGPEARVVAGEGLTAYPGLIEAGTRLGLTEIGAVRATLDAVELGDFNPHLFAASAFNPHSELIPVTRANGITTVLARPGGGILSGQSSLMNLAGWTPDEMTIRARAALQLNLPTATGPGGADAAAARLGELKQMFREARERRPGSGDLVLEALRPYARGELPVIITADRAEQIRQAIELAEELGLKYLLSGVREGYKVAALLKERDVACLVGPILDQPVGTTEPYDVLYTNPQALYQAGVRFAIMSGETANARNLPYHAAMAAAHGLPADVALRAITLAPAELLGIGADYGSLSPGKVANLFLADGDPFDHRTQVKALFIHGRPVSLDNRHDSLYRRFLPRVRSPVGARTNERTNAEADSPRETR
jgi:imidazolonepropionase-like amidohydrolase